MPRVTDDQLLEDIRIVAKKLAKQPTYTEYREHGKYNHTLLARRFGSCPNAVKAAGLLYRYQHPEYRPNDKEVIEDVRRVAKELGKPPTVEEYKQHGRFKVETVYRRAPESHWWSVLVAFLGIEESEARKYCKRGRDDYRTDAERLEELRILARQREGTRDSEKAGANGINVTALYHRFGGYLKAVEAAGLDKPESRTRPGQHLTEEELLQEVRRVIGIVGKFPSPKAFDLHSKINHKTVAKKLGG